MTRYSVCIPTLNQYETVARNIEVIKRSTPPPEIIFVVDNGGSLAPLPGVEVIRPRKNLGVSSSWNLLIKLSNPLRPVILNDDLVPGPAVCGALAASETGLSSLAGQRYSAFSIDQSCYEKVGPFDEAFWPAYCEDEDYDWRLHVAGFIHKTIQGHCKHRRSSTMSSLSSKKRVMYKKAIKKNKRYYSRKWGGGPGFERFLTPFGRGDGQKNVMENDIRKIHYIHACNKTSDINEHLSKLVDISKHCRHITLFGSANCVIAFLYAQPEKLVIYSSKPSKHLQRIKRFAGNTEIIYFEADTRQVDIEQTDFLFIDSYHTASYLTSELEKSSDKVRHFIGCHDTVTYGEIGQNGELGIMYSLRMFLQSKLNWHVLHEEQNNNGLVILGRRS
jgi:hypothetical protein